MTVFVTQNLKPNKRGWIPDLAPASVFGRIEFVYPVDSRVFTDANAAVKVAQNCLADFDEEKDYICWPNSGDPATIYIIIAVLTAMGISKLNYLYWNRKRYDERGKEVQGQGFYTELSVDVADVFVETDYAEQDYNRPDCEELDAIK